MGTPLFYGSVHLLFYRQGEEGLETLLLKRRNTGFKDGMYSLVAGKLDGGEEVKAAAAREAWEEAGVKLDSGELEVAGVYHRLNTDSEWFDFFLVVRRWDGEPYNKEPHKCEELTWFPVNRLPDTVIPYIRNALEKDHSRMWFESVGWAETERPASPALHGPG